MAEEGMVLVDKAARAIARVGACGSDSDWCLRRRGECECWQAGFAAVEAVRDHLVSLPGDTPESQWVNLAIFDSALKD